MWNEENGGRNKNNTFGGEQFSSQQCLLFIGVMHKNYYNRFDKFIITFVYKKDENLFMKLTYVMNKRGETSHNRIAWYSNIVIH